MDRSISMNTISKMKTINHHIKFEENNKYIKRKIGKQLSIDEKFKIKSFIKFMSKNRPNYVMKYLLDAEVIIEQQFNPDVVKCPNPLIVQYVYDIYKLVIEHEVLSGYRIWALEQDGSPDHGYMYTNTLNEVNHLFIEFIREKNKNSLNIVTNYYGVIDILTKQMDEKFKKYYGFPRRKNL